MPGMKRAIKAFIQRVRDDFRLGRNPEETLFDLGEVQDLLRRYQMHKKYTDDSSDLSTAAKPKDFTSESKWVDWMPTFLNYLMCQFLMSVVTMMHRTQRQWQILFKNTSIWHL